MYLQLQGYCKFFKVGSRFFLDIKTVVLVHSKVNPVLIVTGDT